MKVNVIGLGYIGLPTALSLAAKGNQVTGIDCNREIVETLNRGVMTFEEKGLRELYDQARSAGIDFSAEYQSADLYIIAVPTPYIKRDKRVDASYIVKAFEQVLTVCPENAVIVIESTVSPGTIDKHLRPILERQAEKGGKKVRLAHAPERIIPGNMVYELVHNSRIIGVEDQETGAMVKGLYSTFCQGEIVITDIRTAEMSKVVENTYRDINIAFANELAKICRLDHMDVYEIIRIANKHPRVNILNPGPGVGGHCISVDPWFLVGDYPGLANLILAARKINDSMPEFVLERISDIMRERGIKEVSRVGLYGLTYKENVDDLRESPTLQMLENMDRHLARGIKVYDPYVRTRQVPDQFFDLEEFLNAVDMVVIMVGHQQIRDHMDLLAHKVVLDTRNICDTKNVYHL